MANYILVLAICVFVLNYFPVIEADPSNNEISFILSNGLANQIAMIFGGLYLSDKISRKNIRFSGLLIDFKSNISMPMSYVFDMQHLNKEVLPILKLESKLLVMIENNSVSILNKSLSHVVNFKNVAPNTWVNALPLDVYMQTISSYDNTKNIWLPAPFLPALEYPEMYSLFLTNLKFSDRLASIKFNIMKSIGLITSAGGVTNGFNAVHLRLEDDMIEHLYHSREVYVAYLISMMMDCFNPVLNTIS